MIINKIIFYKYTIVLKNLICLNYLKIIIIFLNILLFLTKQKKNYIQILHLWKTNLQDI